MRLARWLFALVLLCSCAAGGKALASAPQESDVREMMASTVRIEVDITVAVKTREGDRLVRGSAFGSGVVYEKSSGLTGPVTSKILSANHVLGSYKLDDLVLLEEGVGFVTKLDFKVLTRDGRTCKLKILNLGPDQNTHDTATGEADCDAGHVAKIAKQTPPEGAKVFIVGYPLGIDHTLVTEGFVSDWAFGGYLQISAPATHGNSGGPVFYNGEVIGLLVRGSDEFHNISLVVPLQSVLDRVIED